VIHSGVWGFASSPIVTEDEIRRITRIAELDVAKASAIAKKTDVKLAPVPAYQIYWATPVQKNPDDLSREAKQDYVQKIVDVVVKNKGVQNVNVSANISYEWKYLATSEGSYIEWRQANPSFSVTARKDDVVRTDVQRGAGHGRVGNHERRRCSRTPTSPTKPSSSPRQADRHGRQGSDYRRTRCSRSTRRQRDRARSHHGATGQLRRHELREGADLGKAEYGSKPFNVTADK
jgi:TldD protein